MSKRKRLRQGENKPSHPKSGLSSSPERKGEIKKEVGIERDRLGEREFNVWGNQDPTVESVQSLIIAKESEREWEPERETKYMGKNCS